MKKLEQDWVLCGPPIMCWKDLCWPIDNRESGYDDKANYILLDMTENDSAVRARRNEESAILRAFLFLFAGFIALWFAKHAIGIKEESVLVSLLLLPLLVYVILSGKIQELKAPGGIEAKFSGLANQSVSAASESVKPETDELQSVLKDSSMALDVKTQELDGSKPILMLMDLGNGRYDTEAALKYIEVLSQFRNFKFVVFLDKRKRFIGYMSAWAVKGLLQKRELGDEFIDAVNRGLSAELTRYPGFETQTITTSWTNANALQEMVRKNVEALVVIDGNRHIEGVVEREQILSLMMLSLVNG